jgi:DNA-binding CsgD family transcriptional regulator
MSMVQGSVNVAFGLAYGGEIEAARVVAQAALDDAAELGEFYECMGYAMLVVVALADGDIVAAGQAGEAGRRQSGFSPAVAGLFVSRWADAALAQGDYTTARQWADEAAAATHGWHLSAVLTTRARIEIASGELEAAERDAHDALMTAAQVETHLFVPDILECLAHLADAGGSQREAVRLYGAAHQARRQMGSVRFRVFDPEVEGWTAGLRDAMGGTDFDAAWAEGTALSIAEATAYAQRGRGERKRPSSGWGSLTPTELDVVRLVAEGIPNKDISTRLFVSPRTVQSHLRHVYRKLGLTSRVQLAQEVARRG